MSVSSLSADPAGQRVPFLVVLRQMERLRQPLWVFDIDKSRVYWANQGGLAIWQADTIEELSARDMGADMSATVAKRLRQYQTDFIRDKEAQFKEIWTLYPNGEPSTVEVIYSGIQLDDGRTAMLCEALQKQHLDADALRSAEALLHTSVMITLYAGTGEPLYRNPAARNTVRVPSETMGAHFATPSHYHKLRIATRDEVNMVANVHTNQGIKWHDITARRCVDAVSGERAWLLSEVDVSKLKATEERAQFLAEHDTLTKLPNRAYVAVAFQRRIDQLLADDQIGALLFLDLDRFKDINDSLGHNAGDQLLVEVSHRLSRIAHSDDNVARLGGDEFLLLLGPVEDVSVVEVVAGQILESIAQPITIQGRPIRVTPSVGISLFPHDGRNIQELMRHADLAMYHAKEHGRNNFEFFTKDLNEAVQTRINLESELTAALQKHQFVTYFQPRVCGRTNQVVGAEALVRWQHPSRGLVAPGHFIAACEASGLITELGKIVLADAVKEQQQWAKLGFDLRISVNLSPVQFGESGLVDNLIEVVRNHGGDPSKFELEITESVLLGHDQATINKLHRLVGLRLSNRH